MLVMQVQATAEVLSRPDVHSRADRFNFRQYMTDRAELVNGALDAAVPLQYPEDVVESMRWGCTASASIASLSCHFWHFEGTFCGSPT